MVKIVDDTMDVVVNKNERHFAVDEPHLVADIRVMTRYGDDTTLAYNRRPGNQLPEEEFKAHHNAINTGNIFNPKFVLFYPVLLAYIEYLSVTRASAISQESICHCNDSTIC